jgi:hypothetical protein
MEPPICTQAPSRRRTTVKRRVVICADSPVIAVGDHVTT